MFHTLLQIDCGADINSSVACTTRETYRMAYLLLRGEDITSFDSDTNLSPELIVMVTFIVILALLIFIGLLASIFLSVLQLDAERITQNTFWESKLSFVLAVNDWDIGLQSLWGNWVCDGILEKYWNSMASNISGINQGTHNVTRDPKRNSLTVVMLWLISITLVPIWLIVGVISLGLLWPPQVRKALFRPFEVDHFHQEQKKRENYNRFQDDAIRDELLKIKVMSVEQSKHLEDDVREIKQLLLAAMQKE